MTLGALVFFAAVLAVICDARSLNETLFRSSAMEINVINASEWQTGRGTWYGPPLAGACGYGELEGTPYDSNIVAIGSESFNDGLGCGACFEVRCVNDTNCREEPTTVVVVTDECPECPADQLDFSGTAFESLAIEGQANITFEVVPGSNEFWIAFLVKYVPGYGALQSVEVQSSGSNTWENAAHLWGAVWQIDGPLTTPTSVRVTTVGGEVATCVLTGITSWSPGETSTCGES
ncbi:putative expansin-B2 [Selaginella moellendorffii]|uniref:putative expansin-B2 n=1 Tax=Selaginella moellendorffii TaxID=88036 RepID=UPI000D1C6ED2|nr:putative expansin-B2 [Selaginella moellendorffii]|eukprot:XP_024545485.1 putative expansin-B2 [Selaginella moellendorffii]